MLLYLESLNYEEKFIQQHFEKISDWKIEGLCFSQFTMITGLNTAGKSRTCNVIRNTIKKFAKPMKTLQLGRHDIQFRTSEATTYRSTLDIIQDNSLKAVIKEEQLYEVKPNHMMLFNREKIYDYRKPVEGAYDDYSPPDDSLTFHSRRDKLSYPYLEEIIAASSKFHFLDIGDSQVLIAMARMTSEQLPLEIMSALTPQLFKQFVTEKEKEKKIIEEINEMGFPVEDILLKGVIVGNEQLPMIFFKEKGVNTPYALTETSTGMAKIVFIILCLNLIEEGSCVLMDNVGDGLDYKRSQELLRIIEEKSKSMQIIVSTNNENLLNQTNILNWNILLRNGSSVQAFNYNNSKDKLLKFVDSGLSNYEYFKDEYYLDKK